MKNYLFLILFIIAIVFINNVYNEKFNSKKKLTINHQKHIEYFKNLKTPIIWIYYENYTNSRFWSSFYGRRNDLDIPAYMFLVFNSIIKNSNNMKVVILNPDNINLFIKNDEFDLSPESKIPYILRLNYIKYYTMYHYGGIWLEHCILLKNITPLVNKLKEFEVLGFGCDNNIYRCNIDKFRPRDDILIARRNTTFMYNCLNTMQYILKNFFNYPSFKFSNYGLKILWNNIDFLQQNNKLSFYQFSSEYDGTRDYNNKLITAENLLSLNNTKLLDEERAYLIKLDHNALYNNFSYQWFLRMSVDQLLNSNLWFSYLYKKSMNYEYYNNYSITDFKIRLPPTAQKYLYAIYNSNLYSTPTWYLFFNSSSRNS